MAEFPLRCSKKTCQYQKLVATLYHKVLFMTSQHQSLDTLQDIKRMMERSSRFISLSGWSGVSAGCCALVGAWLANNRLHELFRAPVPREWSNEVITSDLTDVSVLTDLILIGICTFVAAFISSFFFTWLRSRKQKTPLWDRTVQRLMWNTVLPLAIGGLVIIRCLQLGYFELVAPGCLIFYGLALVNASKYTLGEIRYLGYGQLIIGIINLWAGGDGLYFWAAGFGVLHIIYGAVMWWKYERKP